MRSGSSRAPRLTALSASVALVVFALPLGLFAHPGPGATNLRATQVVAASPAITVTPDTALTSGQTVTVEGTGFAAGDTVELAECEAGTNHCNDLGRRLVATDGSGAFSSSFTVSRGVNPMVYPGAIVDCAAAPGTCEILAFSTAGNGQAVAALTFDGSAVVPVPSVVVTPSLDLADRAIVAVDASGLEPMAQVSVQQCIADQVWCSFGPAPLVTADGSGNVHTMLRVHREISGLSPGTTNCATTVGTCTVRVASPMEPLARTDVPLGFDPTAVVPSDAALVVSPPGPWEDGQVVTLTGSGFSPGAELGVAECAAAVAGASGATACARELLDPVYTDADGGFSLTFTITRTFVLEYGETVDCATVEGGCLLLAANRSDWVERVLIPIEFVPAISPAFTG